MLECIVCHQVGGIFVILENGAVHKKCRGGVALRDVCTNPFSFSSPHITGDPNLGAIQVNGLAHLRRLEKEHGVTSVLANYDRPNDPIPGGKEQFHSRGER